MTITRPNRTRTAALLVPVLVAAVLAANAAPVSAQVATTGGGFTDVGSGVHAPAIEAFDASGVFDGTECSPSPRRRFCGSDPLLRSWMAVWLVRLLAAEQPAPFDGAGRFADVEPGEWWLAHVELLADWGVTKGCKAEPARFCPDGSVTRAQMASFLVRAFDLPAADAAAGFGDVTRDAAHAASIDALAQSGVTAGCSAEPRLYCPNAPVTRAQMATFLLRAVAALDLDAGRGTPEGGSYTDAEPWKIGEQFYGPWTPPQHGAVPEVAEASPPMAWQPGGDLSNRFYPDGTSTSEKALWLPVFDEHYAYCLTTSMKVSNCGKFDYQFKLPIEYLGAHPQCVVNAYIDQVDYLLQERRDYANYPGWHWCATVVNPLADPDATGDWTDRGLLLGDTISFAELCQTVLLDHYPDIELNRRVNGELIGYGNDCVAWTDALSNTNTYRRGGGKRDCWIAFHLAREWMEHVHGQPERYKMQKC